MHVAIKPRQRDALLAEQRELEERYGYAQSEDFWSATQSKSLLATKRYCAGLYDSGSGHLHPLNYTLGLAAAAQAAGVSIFEDSRGDRSRAQAILPSSYCSSGRVKARFVALCCNAYIDGLDAAAAIAHHAGRHLHRRHRTAGRSTHDTA